MYCGDETGGIVFDAGSYSCKVGYAGDDLPKSVFPGRVGVLKSTTEKGAARASTENAPKTRYIVGPSSSMYRPGGQELKPPMDFGLYDDWEMMEAVWQYGFDGIHADAREHPIIITEPGFSIMAQREKMAEIMFETFDVPAMYLARQPVLAAFSTGRGSAVVVDLGHSCTRVSAVYDGYVINKSLHMSEIGGNSLNIALHEMLQKEHEQQQQSGAAAATAAQPKPEVLPRYAFSKVAASSSGGSGGSGAGAGSSGMDVDDSSNSNSGTSSSSSNSSASSSSYTTGNGRWRVTKRVLSDVTSSFHMHSVLDVYDDMKRSVCEVAELGVEEGKVVPPKSYELPDGNVITLGQPRQLVPELLFRPLELIDAWRLSISSRTTANWTTHYNSGVIVRSSLPPNKDGTPGPSYPPPLQQMVYNALLSCNPEIRKELCGHVILSGGGSLMKDLHKRMHWEMLVLIPAAFKPRVVTPAPTEREYANWIGGSVLASLGTFQQNWVSRQEYDEEGPSVVERKCM